MIKAVRGLGFLALNRCLLCSLAVSNSVFLQQRHIVNSAPKIIVTGDLERTEFRSLLQHGEEPVESVLNMCDERELLQTPVAQVKKTCDEEDVTFANIPVNPMRLTWVSGFVI